MAYDGAGFINARGLRLTKLDSTGAPLVGTANCYVTQALTSMGFGLTYTEPDAVVQPGGRGTPCYQYQPKPTVSNGLIDALTVCTWDPYIAQFLIGGTVILTPSEVQTITVTGSPTGGTFTLTFTGQTTGTIAYNATAATIKTTLEALSNINPGDVVLTGGPLPATPVVVTFQGQYAGTDVALMTDNDAGLTGGTTPAVTVTTTTPGGTGNAIGYAAPTVNVDATPYGVAIEAFSNAIIDGAYAGTLPYQHHVFPRCYMRLAENFTLTAANFGTPIFSGTCEQNANFGDGPVSDIAFSTTQVWQHCRVATDPSDTPGFFAVV